MNYLFFGLTAVVLAAIILILESKFDLLRNSTTTTNKSYSYARVELTWWTFIVLTCFISIFWCTGQIPSMHQSAIILLGIGAATAASARVIDVSDESHVQANIASGVAPVTLAKDKGTRNFFIDILSDKNGVSIHRFQAVVFNFIFGVWFLYQVVQHIKTVGITSAAGIVNNVMPDISTNNLILLGLSAGTYAALKTMENK